jgi:hypothetical protein
VFTPKREHPITSHQETIRRNTMDREGNNTRFEKFNILKDMGYRYDPETGKIYGVYGKEIIGKNGDGYISISKNLYFKGHLSAHHFAWYWIYGNVDFEQLDHINRDKTDNRISNLRIATHQQNQFNKNPKGYYWNTRQKKWQSTIKCDKKQIHLGFFNNEDDAKKAYLNAKEIYHQG